MRLCGYCFFGWFPVSELKDTLNIDFSRLQPSAVLSRAKCLTPLMFNTSLGANETTCRSDAHAKWNSLVMNVNQDTISSAATAAATTSRRGGSGAGAGNDAEILLRVPEDASVLTSPADDALLYCKLENLTMVFFGDVCHFA